MLLDKGMTQEEIEAQKNRYIDQVNSIPEPVTQFQDQTSTNNSVNSILFVILILVITNIIVAIALKFYLKKKKNY